MKKEIEDLASLLEKRSKSELITLIQKMIERQPDLKILLELPLPGIDTGEKPLDVQVIRRQVEHAFRSPRGKWEMGWGDPYDIAEELRSLFDLAGQYQAQDSPRNAATIYCVIAETVLHYEDAVTQDEDDWLGGVIDDCAEGLDECLESSPDAVQRENILKVLFGIYAWDMKAGGIGIGESVPAILLEKVTPQEQQMISEWIETALPGMGDWSRQAMGGLLLDLRRGFDG